MIPCTKTSKTFAKCILKSICFINQFSKLYIPVNLFFMTIQGLFPALLIAIMQKAINLLQKNTSDFSKISAYLFLYIGVNILNTVLLSVYNYYSAKFNMQFSNYINLKMLKKASELHTKDFENPVIYDIINRAQTQNGNSILSFVTESFLILKSVIIIASTSIILVEINWWMIIIILVIPVIRCIITILLNKKWHLIRKERTPKERQKWYINYLMMMGNAVKEIKIFRLSKYLIQKYDEIAKNIIKQDLKMQKINIITVLILDFLDGIITGIIYVYTVFRGFKTILLIGDVIAYISGVEKIKDNTTSVFLDIENITEQSLYVDFLFQYFEICIISRKGNIKIQKIQKIELINLSYKYNNKKNYVLKNINMILTINSHIALIGENGSGKTTLIKLIIGLYENYEGEIFVNDINLKNIDIDDYQKN